MGFLIKYVDKSLAYYLAFAFRVGNTGQLAEKFLTGINAYHIKAKAFIVTQHVAELVFAQHSVINKYAGKVFAYCPV